MTEIRFRDGRVLMCGHAGELEARGDYLFCNGVCVGKVEDVAGITVGSERPAADAAEAVGEEWMRLQERVRR